MPPKSSSNPARVSGRIIKQARNRRRRLMRPSPPPPPPWADLPFEITANILHRLTTIEKLETAQNVCKSWRIVCNDPSMWRVIDIPKSRGRSRRTYADLRKMCHQAVELSQGQLVDINLECFPSDKLLVYIAKRSEKLRRLRLARCDRLYDHGLKKAIERFTNLEEFDIILGTPHSRNINDVEAIIEKIGESCPLLRSFALKLDQRERFDEGVYAIARSMPELRHLKLGGNILTKEGLEAILSGCPHLESLDLYGCYLFRLKGDEFRKICRRRLTQLKCLKWMEQCKYPLRKGRR